MKAYTTRVGKGPFVTELLDETGDFIRERGQEYGATTGRPRRCGWLDLVIVNFAVRIGGITSIALSRLDTLGEMPRVKVCTGYDIGGRAVNNYPASLDDIARAEADIRGIRRAGPGTCRTSGSMRTCRRPRAGM